MKLTQNGHTLQLEDMEKYDKRKLWADYGLTKPGSCAASPETASALDCILLSACTLEFPSQRTTCTSISNLAIQSAMILFFYDFNLILLRKEYKIYKH